ncbi:MAG: hypothetical protein DRR42_09910 [Gammaproteobacteria bacterium]|nr:MAG: hypothetical protein DRR42_09910 [Gammaproteobacteria bacterium]
MFHSGYEARTICFILWFLGTIIIMLMGNNGAIRADYFNDVPWSKCLKSPQHQVFILTMLSWLTMWGV